MPYLHVTTPSMVTGVGKACVIGSAGSLLVVFASYFGSAGTFQLWLISNGFLVCESRVGELLLGADLSLGCVRAWVCVSACVSVAGFSHRPVKDHAAAAKYLTGYFSILFFLFY